MMVSACWGRDYTKETRDEALLAAGTGGSVSPPPVPLRDSIDGPRRPLTAGEKSLIREFRSASLGLTSCLSLPLL